MRTSHKLTRLILALMSLLTLASASFAQIYNPGGTQAQPPYGTPGGVPNFPTTTAPGFRGDWNNQNVAANGNLVPRNLVAGPVDPPVQVQVSDQKAGSLLVYPYYNSNMQGTVNTWATITNTSNTAVTVHIFFLDKSCSQADQFLCLTANASLQMIASTFDPGTQGWILAVAVDGDGRPAQRNVLIGNAFVLDGVYSGNYGAEAFTAYTNAPTNAVAPNAGVTIANVGGFVTPAQTAIFNAPGCRADSTVAGAAPAATGFVSGNGYIGNGYIPGLYTLGSGGATATLNFTGPPTFCSAFNNVPAGTPPTLTDLRTFQLNGGGYDFVPNRFAVEIQSPNDTVNAQRIVVVGLSGDISTAGLTGGAQVGTGTVINGNETPFGSFVNLFGTGCQKIADITVSNPRVPRGLGQTATQPGILPPGTVGTMQFSVGAGVGLIMTPTGGKTPAGIRTLHKTSVNSAVVNASTQATVTITNPPGTASVSIDAPVRYGVGITIPIFLPPACQ